MFLDDFIFRSVKELRDTRCKGGTKSVQQDLLPWYDPKLSKDSQPPESERVFVIEGHQRIFQWSRTLQKEPWDREPSRMHQVCNCGWTENCHPSIWYLRVVYTFMLMRLETLLWEKIYCSAVLSGPQLCLRRLRLPWGHHMVHWAPPSFTHNNSCLEVKYSSG